MKLGEMKMPPRAMPEEVEGAEGGVEIEINSEPIDLAPVSDEELMAEVKKRGLTIE